MINIKWELYSRGIIVREGKGVGKREFVQCNIVYHLFFTVYRGRLLRKNYADIRRKQKVLKFRHSKALHCFMWETSGRVTFVRR